MSQRRKLRRQNPNPDWRETARRLEARFEQMRREARASLVPTRGELPPSYFHDASALFDAAQEYLLAHPGQILCFELPPHILDPIMMPLGNLDALAKYALDDESAEFIRWLDQRTECKCTVFQFRVMVVPLLSKLRQGAEA